MQRERVHLDAARALPGREAHDEVEAVDVVLGEREDEAERDARGARWLEVRERGGEGARPARIASCSVGRAVDRDREDVHERREGAQRAGDRSIPFVVTVVSMPSGSAPGESSASGL